MPDFIEQLEQTIRERRAAGASDSYVASLAAKGRAKLAQKLGEEAVETVIAAVAGDDDATISEAADLVFHLLMLLADMDLSFDDVLDELRRREGVSGIAEKSSRTRA
ncbi:MAG: phosphoribosyl-ATP diphosphatase [Blastomonas sp.]